jgi:ABC-type branched-subunit amino acid transport system ATPase component
MIRTIEVSKSFGGIKAVDDVSMTFYDKKITGLIGPNGAGKTTLFNIINGFLKPDRGEVYLNDRRIDNLLPYQIAQLGVGRMFQDTRVLGKMTVLENVMLSVKEQTGENPLNVFLKFQRMEKEEKWIREEAMRWLEFVGLKDKIYNYAENLSYGQQKLLTLARLLAGNNDIFLLDEPTAGVDPGFIPVILNLLRGLVKEGKTIILIEHNMTAVLEVCDWVYFMDEGKIISFGLPSEVLAHPEVREAYLGL